MGPGTHIVNRIKNNIMPINKTDTAAMLHDVNYMLANGDKHLLQLADDKALKRASGEGYVPMWLGLKIRRLLGLYEGNRSQDNRRAALGIVKHLLTSKNYESFNINYDDFVGLS